MRLALPLVMRSLRTVACANPVKAGMCGRNLSSSASQRSVTIHDSRKTRQRLFVAGVNPFLPPSVRNATSPTFVEVDFAEWLGSIGVKTGSGPEQLEITHVATGHGHALMAYRYEGVESIFAIGRNESGQLGIGYNSQEPTRGLVEGFSGDYVQAIRCGITSTYIQMQHGDKSTLFVCGNHVRGQLGLPPAKTDGERPTQALTSRATLSALPDGVSVSQIRSGYEHAVALSEDGKVWSSGIGTDGQLGRGDDLDQHAFSQLSLPSQLAEEGVAAVEAGADTSAILSGQGNLWTFGNSEYAQAFQGHKIDRILQPTPINASALEGASVASFRTGGSFSLLLDDRGLVYSAGFGAVGQGDGNMRVEKPTRIADLEGIRSISAGPGYAMAVNEHDEVFAWGLNTSAGRLGFFPAANATQPTRIGLPVPGRCSITSVGLGAQTSWILTKEYLE